MQRGLLITCPTHDDATAYLVFFSKAIISEAAGKSLKIKRVDGKNLNMEDFSEIVEKLDYRLVVLNGHGSPDSVFGYKENIIVKAGENDKMLNERIVYARSCNAGVVLGPSCMEDTKKGCFIGYILPFIFYMDEKWTANPHNDEIAGLFLEPSNLVPLSIIKGHSALDAHNNAKRQMLRVMEKLTKNKPEDETPFYLGALWNNYIGQVIFGNAEARL